MSGLSTHVLDTAQGRPAAGVAVTLAMQKGDGWQEVTRGKTDADGRIATLLKDGALQRGATYRLRFEIKTAFYPYVDVVFTANDDRHHHVPLLVSPFGYSTYRGS